MKKLLLEELILVSHRERKARIVEFDQKVTILMGQNDVGKSSILKSIYYTLGAEPTIINSSWRSANIISCLIFTIDGRKFTIIRHGKTFALFNSSGEILLLTNSVTKELGPMLAELLDFNLVLTSKQDEAIIPPPAYIFLPFYIDQDKGWQQTWSSFKNLAQFKDWRKGVINYHSGIRPKKYYEVKGQSEALKINRNTLQLERCATETTFERMRRDQQTVSVDFDPQALERRISALLREGESLYKYQIEVRQELSDLISRRATVKDQINIAKSALAELDKDYAYIRGQAEDSIQCPTCGTYHENSFTNRFSLVDDRESCRLFLTEAKADLEKLNASVENGRRKLVFTDDKIARIQRLLEEQKEGLSLKDFIDSESEKKLEFLMNSRINELSEEISGIDRKIASHERELKRLQDPKRKKEIEGFYLNNMVNHLRMLRVGNINTRDVQPIDCLIKTSGSDQPRAVLAYVYAYLKTITKYSTSLVAPLVVDAPLQQEPDAENRQKIVEFLFRERPNDIQMVLGIVSLFGAQPQGKIIELGEKYQVLQSREYDSAAQRIRPLEDALI
jgi:predicted  nucleic acid-binding Zn-ribbon protein